jgi:hypothetical protein
LHERVQALESAEASAEVGRVRDLAQQTRNDGQSQSDSCEIESDNRQNDANSFPPPRLNNIHDQRILAFGMMQAKQIHVIDIRNLLEGVKSEIVAVALYTSGTTS